MFRFKSLRSRLVIFTTVPLITILVTTLLLTTRSAKHTVRTNMHKSLTEAASVFAQLVATRQSELISMAQVTASDPKFFASFSIPPEARGDEFKPTLDGVASDFLAITEADFIEIYDSGVHSITRVERDRPESSGLPQPAAGSDGLRRTLNGSVVGDFFEMDGRIVVAATAPVYVGRRLEALVRLGRYLDDTFIAEVKRLTGTDICLARDGAAVASTFASEGGSTPPTTWKSDGVAPAAIGGSSMALGEAFSIAVSSEEYLTIPMRVTGVNYADGFDAFIGRKLSTQLLPVIRLEKSIALGGLLAVLVTLAVSFLVSVSITQPLSEIVDASTAIQNGDYDYPVSVTGSDEVARLGNNFNQMRESLSSYVEHLKNLDQAKSNFIALASHELRTPLTVITGFNEMITSGALGEVSENVRETAGVIKEQLTGLNRMVQSMLDLTYLEQGIQTMMLAPTDMTALARAALATRSDVIASRNLKADMSAPAGAVWANVDADRMQDAVTRILDNAIRFTPDGGQVAITVTREKSQAVIAIADNGVGIPPQELKWIFQKVYEVGDVMHHTSGQHGFRSGGLGLGLALCKAVVEHHGGSIAVESTPGRGSEFQIRLQSMSPPPGNVVTLPEEEKGVLV